MATLSASQPGPSRAILSKQADRELPHRLLTDYNMAYSKPIPTNTWELNLTNNESKAVISWMGDSWVAHFRILSDRINKHKNYHELILSPHEIKLTDKDKDTFHKAYINYQGKSSATMNRILCDYDLFRKWSNHLPRITILHVGACDIANEDIGRSDKIRVDFPVKVIDFLNKFKQKARQSAHDVAKFDSAISEHTFLIIGVPDWGKFTNRPGKEDCELNCDKFRSARKKANDGLNNNRPSLYNLHRAVVYTPNLQHPIRNGVHLANISQEEYINKILNVVIKLLCSSCKLGNKYVAAEHKLLDNGICIKTTNQDSGTP